MFSNENEPAAIALRRRQALNVVEKVHAHLIELENQLMGISVMVGDPKLFNELVARPTSDVRAELGKALASIRESVEIACK